MQTPADSAAFVPQSWSIPGAPVKGYVWHAPSPAGVVLLTHGFGEYAARYTERYHGLIPALLGAGFTVYAYDQRGHGASAGARAVVNVEQLVSDHLKAREALRGQALPVFAFGHSLGGLVTAASAARDPRGLSGVVLSSPALLVGENEPALLKTLAPWLGRIMPGFPVTELRAEGISRRVAEVEAYRKDPQIYQGKVPALSAAGMLGLSASLWPLYARWQLPVLVVHGSADQLTDVRGSRRFIQAITAPDKSYYEIEGGFHELLNDDARDEVRDLILNWLSTRIKAL